MKIYLRRLLRVLLYTINIIFYSEYANFLGKIFGGLRDFFILVV